MQPKESEGAPMTPMRRLNAAEGYTAYIGSPPPRHALVRFWNESTGQQWTGFAADMHPESNVAYLWWKLTGIASAEKGRAA